MFNIVKFVHEHVTLEGKGLEPVSYVLHTSSGAELEFSEILAFQGESEVVTLPRPKGITKQQDLETLFSSATNSNERITAFLLKDGNSLAYVPHHEIAYVEEVFTLRDLPTESDPDIV